MKLSKTNYLVYRDCAHNAWVKAHLSVVYKEKPLSAFDQAIIETGNDVDVLARDLFPGGVLIERGDAVGTAKLVSESAAVLYQPVFETARYTIACDILVWNGETQSYDVYEVKTSTSGDDRAANDELYTHDIAFQAHVLRENGVPLGALYLVRLNGEYVSDGELDLEELFARENFSERVALGIEVVRAEMEVAHAVLQRDALLAPPCSCIYKGRSSHCTTFAYTNPTIPEYSVHDLARIGTSRKKLAALVDAGILSIPDVPDDFELTEKQRNQITATKTGQSFVDKQRSAPSSTRSATRSLFSTMKHIRARSRASRGMGRTIKSRFNFRYTWWKARAAPQRIMSSCLPSMDAPTPRLSRHSKRRSRRVALLSSGTRPSRRASTPVWPGGCGARRYFWTA